MRKQLLVILLTLVLLIGSWFLFIRNDEEPVELTPIDTSVQEQQPEEIEEEPLFDGVQLQTVVDEWVAAQRGDVSVVIMDPSREEDGMLALHNPDTNYFAASMYKLFVVYSGYQTLDDGTYNADDEYLNGQTREECLDKAIRSSDSPCAETWWNELGKEELTTQMSELGMSDTSLTSIRTTAQDVATMLGLIWRGEGLSDQAREQYLDSMREQEVLYRRGLPSGFSEGVSVYNKVGWNLSQEWHDGAIVDFGDDRVLVVSLMSENVGMNAIASLASQLEEAVVNSTE